MKRAPSALTAIGGFSVAIAVLSVAITASIVLLTPDPPAIRMTVDEAAAALRGTTGALERSSGTPPNGPSAPLLQQSLARTLGTPASSVRVVWLDKTASKTLPRQPAVVMTTARGQTPVSIRNLMWPNGKVPRDAIVFKRVNKRQGDQPLRLSADVSMSSLIDGVLRVMPQPAFAASVRAPDGQWTTVAPRFPIFAGWRLKLLAALAASLAVLAPLVWLFARRLTRPFRALATAIDDGSDPPLAQGPRELQDAAAAILQLRTRLAADADERTRMLTAVAHDLRTPLTSLRLRIESVAEPQRARMIADADRMQGMIGDVLDFARTADAPRHPLPVRATIADILADLPKVRLADGPENHIAVVGPAFRRAMENLIRNAIDYAGGGQIDVSRDNETCVIRVSDTGPGIPAHDRARLLRPFERGDSSRNRDTGGVGLGLSIVQSFALSHGGSLSLEGAPDGGTLAILRLPEAGRCMPA